MVRQYKSKVSLNTLNSQRNYSFGFDYLNSTFIHVNLNGVELTQPRDFTVNEHEIILVNPPTTGGSLLIYRVTPSNRIVSWTDNSILKADNLNLSYIQLMHLAEEQMDNVRDETITRALDEAWDVKGSRIKRLGTPTDDMDAVPYGYVRHQKEEVEQLTAEVRQHKNTIEQAQRDILSRQSAVEATAQRVTEQLNTGNAELTNKITKAKSDIELLGSNTNTSIADKLNKATTNITELGERTTTEVTSRINSAKQELTTQVTTLKQELTSNANTATSTLNATIRTANEVKTQIESASEKLKSGVLDEKTKSDIANSLLSKQEAVITRKLDENNTSQARANESLIASKISEHNADITAHNLNKYMSMKPMPTGINDWNNLTDTGMYEATASMWGWRNAPSATRIYYYGVVQVIKSDTNRITQVFYSYGANNKPCNICYRTFYNAWGAWHYHGDYDATVTDITKHNEGLTVTKGDTASLLKLFTNNKEDTDTSLAPTLAVVKELLSNVGKSTEQRLDVHIEGETIKSYILIGKGDNTVIIQFGHINLTHLRGAQQYKVAFPIAFRKRCFGIFYSHSNITSDELLATVCIKKLDKTSFTLSEFIATQIASSQTHVTYMAIGV